MNPAVNGSLFWVFDLEMKSNIKVPVAHATLLKIRNLLH